MNEREKLKEIISLTLKIDEYITTVKKALSYDEDQIDGFVNQYSTLLKQVEGFNWQVHDLAESWKGDYSRIESRLNKELKRTEGEES